MWMWSWLKLRYQSLGEQQPKRAKRGAFEIPSSLPLRASFLGFFGLLLGAILALVLERLNRRIDTRPELAEACQLPIIAEVGFVPEKRRPTQDGALLLAGVWAESYRRVRSASSQSCEVFPGDCDRLIHLVFGFEKDFVDQGELRLARCLLRHMK